MDNSNNLLFADTFCNQLETESRKNNWTYKKLFSIKGNTTKKTRTIPLTIDYTRDDFIDQAICKVKLHSNLYCHILASGVGIFEFLDLECAAMANTSPEIRKYSKPLIANYQKKITQAMLLSKMPFADACSKIGTLILQFETICWKLVANGVKHKKIKCLRQFSGNINYKSNGLSYVLTIYLFKNNELTEKELEHLMCSSIFAKVTSPDNWNKIDNEIHTTEAIERPYSVESGSTKVYASWSAVAVVSDKKISTIDDIKRNTVISHLIKVEAYVQSRWFVADNSMDNINKNSTASLVGLQRIASLMEFCQAELDNEISANMGTLQKNLLKLIVDTSSVKQLYRSVLNQMKTQIKIKEAHYQDKKRKNKLIVDLFLAIFSASSLYKTIMDLIKASFSLTNWIIFFSMFGVAIGTIIFNYKNR